MTTHKYVLGTGMVTFLLVSLSQPLLRPLTQPTHDNITPSKPAWEQSDVPTFYGSSEGTHPTRALATAYVHLSFVLWPPLNSGPHRLHPHYCNSLLNSLSTLYSLHEQTSSLKRKTNKNIWKQWFCDLKASLAPYCLTGEKDRIQGSPQSGAQESPQLHLQSLNLPLPALSLWWHQLSIISRTSSERLHLNTCYSLQLECYLLPC